MILENSFKQVTHLFYSSQYEEGLQILCSLIDRFPKNSILYTNRAIFYSQLSEDEKAIQDVSFSLELNPLNYIGYFNLFSLLTRNNEDENAFRNLCCSLSVLYLLRGRLKRQIKDLDKAIFYASNNLQARILKSLLFAQVGKFEQAKQTIIEALNIDSKNILMQRLLAQFSKKVDPEYQQQQSLLKPTAEQSSRLLKCQLTFQDEFEYITQINQKVQQFSLLYEQHNSKLGSITQKVPKDSLSHKIDAYLLEKSRTSKKSNRSAIAVLEDDFFADEQNFTHNQGKESDSFPATTQNEGTQSRVRRFPDDDKQDFQVIEQGQSKAQTSNAEYSQVIIPKSNIYPLVPGLKLRITVIHFTFFNAEHPQNLTQLYSILSYNKGQQKLISTVASCQQDCVSWNQTFRDIQLSTEPSLLRIQLYNKVKTSIQDLLIGQFEVIINTAELMKLPLYDRQEEQVGKLLLHLKAVIQ